LKQSVCRRMLDRAKFYGSRTVADGIETWSDFLTVRDLGFDLVQGSLFAKAYERKEVRANLLGRAACLSRLATLEIDRTAQPRRRQRAAGRNGRATRQAFQQEHRRSMALSARRFTSRCALECVAHGEKHLLQRCFEHAEVGHV
jgi:hypothetical protein